MAGDTVMELGAARQRLLRSVIRPAVWGLLPKPSLSTAVQILRRGTAADLLAARLPAADLRPLQLAALGILRNVLESLAVSAGLDALSVAAAVSAGNVESVRASQSAAAGAHTTTWSNVADSDNRAATGVSGAKRGSQSRGARGFRRNAAAADAAPPAGESPQA
jgi:hypothetical protein